MKKVLYILLFPVAFVAMLFSCGNLTDVENSIPEVHTDDLYSVSTHSAYVRNTNTVSVGTDFLLLSTTQNMSDSIICNNTVNIENNSMWAISNLLPGTIYYYKHCVTDGLTVVSGETKHFTTDKIVYINSVKLTDWGDKPSYTDYVSDNLGISYVDTTDVHYPISGYINKLVSYNEKSGQWNIEELLPQFGNNFRIYAYAPYMSKLSNGRVYVDVTEKNCDLLYGSSGVVNKDNPKADIVLHHKMARVIFSITASESDNVKNSFNALWLLQSGVHRFATKCYMNVVTGKMNYDYTSYNADGIYRNFNSFVPDTKTPVNIELTVIPSDDSDTMKLVLYNTDSGYGGLSVSMFGCDWKEGYQYIYPVTVSQHKLIVGDVQVTSWNNNDGGTIIINK